jgi:hypothetical protein
LQPIPPVSGTIDPKVLTVTGLTAAPRVYDGMRGTVISGDGVLSGVVPGESVSVTGVPLGEFETASVGVGKPVRVSGLGLAGANASNYTLPQPVLGASITNFDPVWTPVPDQSLDELGTLELTLVASDADGAVQRLTYALRSGPPGVTLSGGGSLSWTPTEAQGPSTNRVEVGVTDGWSEVVMGFNVVVREVNRPPVLPSVGQFAINELEAWSFNAGGEDADVPVQSLTHALVSGPAGVSVSRSGLITWIPSEAQGPATHIIRYSVTDGVATTEGDIVVVVREVNTGPVLATVSNRTLDELTTLSLSLSATDVDIPAQSLTYWIVSGPPGMTVNASSGALAWTPTEAQGPSTTTVLVAVTDGVASVTNSFTVVVR